MALVSGEFFEVADKESVPAIFLKTAGSASRVHIYVFDVEGGPRLAVARLFESKDDMQPGDRDVFILDAE
jgi:hypothetical protein